MGWSLELEAFRALTVSSWGGQSCGWDDVGRICSTYLRRSGCVREELTGLAFGDVAVEWGIDAREDEIVGWAGAGVEVEVVLGLSVCVSRPRTYMFINSDVGWGAASIQRWGRGREGTILKLGGYGRGGLEDL